MDAMQGRILARKEIRISCCDETTRDFEILEVFSTNSRQSGTTVARRYLRLVLAQFNKIKDDSIDGERQVEQFITSYEIKREEQQNRLTLKLPDNTDLILLFFGAINYFIQHMHYQGKKDGFDISFYLNDELVPSNNLSIARKLANWFIKKTKNTPAHTAREKAAEMIKNYLFHPLTPLSTHVFQHLHPESSLVEQISRLAKNDLEKALTFPDTTYQQKSEILLTWLKGELGSKSSKDSRNQLVDTAVHERIHQQLVALEHLKNEIKVMLIKSVYGKPACDGGCYDEKYYEIQMLCAATLAVNKDGIFELDYTGTDIYKKIYAVTKEAEPELKREVTELFKYLGLEFKPNQNFHGKLLFTTLSNEKLMRRGLGWTKSTCVDVIKWGRFFKGIREVPLLSNSDSNLQKFIASQIPLR